MNCFGLWCRPKVCAGASAPVGAARTKDKGTLRHSASAMAPVVRRAACVERWVARTSVSKVEAGTRRGVELVLAHDGVLQLLEQPRAHCFGLGQRGAEQASVFLPGAPHVSRFRVPAM